MGILDNQEVLDWAYQAIERRTRRGEKQYIQDITHNAVVAALRHMNQFNPSKGNIYVFLNLYLRGALHHFRTTQAGHPGRSFKSMESGDKSKRPTTGRLHSDIRVDNPDPLSELIKQEEIKWLKQQVNLLPPRQSIILNLYLQGLTYEQIGQQVGLTERMIKYYMSRSRYNILNSHRNTRQHQR